MKSFVKNNRIWPRTEFSLHPPAAPYHLICSDGIFSYTFNDFRFQYSGGMAIGVSTRVHSASVVFDLANKVPGFIRRLKKRYHLTHFNQAKNHLF